MAKANSTVSRSKRASAQSVSPILKCGKGDLAIRLDSGCEGLIVEVGEYVGTVEGLNNPSVISDAWRIHHPSCEAGWRYFCEDKYLLPIRPGDLDETETDELGLKEGARHD